MLYTGPLGKWAWKDICPARKSTCPGKADGTFFEPCMGQKSQAHTWRVTLKDFLHKVKNPSYITSLHNFIDTESKRLTAITFIFLRLKPATRMEASEAGESASQSQAVSTDQQAQQNQMQQHQQYLGDVTQGLPEFDELDLKDCPLPGYSRLIYMYLYIYRASLTFSWQCSHLPWITLRLVLEFPNKNN